jgi:hypothetical protein
MSVVHIRQIFHIYNTLCGVSSGESISPEYWITHVLPNRDACCRNLYKRVCRECVSIITTIGEEQ